MYIRMLALLLALLLPCLAFAEEYVPYEVFTFAGTLPERLKEPLGALIPDESAVLSGAAIQCNGNHVDATSPAHQDCYSALVLAESGEEIRLYAAAQPEGQPWQVCDYSRFLRSAQFRSISIYQPKADNVPRFSIDYYSHKGQCSDTMVFRNNQLWHLTGHTNQTTGVSISTGYDTLSYDCPPLHQEYLCATPFFMDYMAGIADFPTTQAEIEKLAVQRESLFHAAPGDVVYSAGANLRREPTTKSESLGVYAHNVPMVFTGEQKQGAQWPWYQVRIGGTVGWMSGNYVSNQISGGALPVSLGRTVDGSLLYADADANHPTAQLQPGVTFHILTEYQEMYHICIPEKISWAVDAGGLYGYIPAVGIVTGASPARWTRNPPDNTKTGLPHSSPV